MFRQSKFRTLYNEVKSSRLFLKLIFSILYDGVPFRLKFILSNNTKRVRQLDEIVNFPENKNRRIHPYILNPYLKTNHLSISSYQLFKDPLQRYLRWEDRNSMAHSVEARVPFLDYRLVEFTTGLPLGYLDFSEHSKRILVESMTGILTEEVRLRKDKVGFITPEQIWFMEDYKQEFMEMLKSNVAYSKGIIKADKAEKFFKDVQNGVVPFDYTYWRLIQFCIWMKVFKVELEGQI